MKNKFGNKAVSSVSIIGKDDGPTSVFIVGRSNSKWTEIVQNRHSNKKFKNFFMM